MGKAVTATGLNQPRPLSTALCEQKIALLPLLALHLCLKSCSMATGTLSAATTSGTTTMVPPQCARDLGMVGSPQALIQKHVQHTAQMQWLGQPRIWRRMVQGWNTNWCHCDLQLIWLTEAARSTRQKHSCIRMNASKMKARTHLQGE